MRGKELLNIYLQGEDAVAIGIDKSMHIGVIGSGIVIREHRQDVLNCIDEIFNAGRNSDEFADLFNRVAMVEYDFGDGYATIDVYPLPNGDMRMPTRTMWTGLIKDDEMELFYTIAETLVPIKTIDGDWTAFASLIEKA